MVVCESGIKFAENITALKSLNIQAVLVGTALMGAGNPGEMAKEMVLGGKGIKTVVSYQLSVVSCQKKHCEKKRVTKVKICGITRPHGR